MQLILHSIFKIRIDRVGMETVEYQRYGIDILPSGRPPLRVRDAVPAERVRGLVGIFTSLNDSAQLLKSHAGRRLHGYQLKTAVRISRSWGRNG
jgi:hypothetical protein